MAEDLAFSKEGIGLVTAKAEPEDYTQIGMDTGQKPCIYLHYALFRRLDDFALRNTSKEQAGLLLGSHTKDNAWLRIEEAVEVKPRNDSFPESVWKEALAQASKQYPGTSVVGWFYSHPSTGISLTPQEEEIHKRFFPKSSQVIYISDPVVSERTFYLWQDGKLINSTGFRIYGKTEKVSTIIGREPARPDEYMNERYLERSVEKLQRMLRHPAIRPIDYAVLVLAALCLAVLILRPAPAVRVDQSELLANQERLSQQVSAVEKRLQEVEGHLEAVGMLDKELGLAPADDKELSSESPAPPKVREESPAPKVLSAAKDPKAAQSGAKVLLHTVQAGETISSIADRYYGTTDPKVCKALGRFNKLPAPHYEHIIPGDELKIPARAKVGL